MVATVWHSDSGFRDRLSVALRLWF
jgi:hypothetical protein